MNIKILRIYYIFRRMKTGITLIYSTHLSETENQRFEEHVKSTCGLKKNLTIIKYVNMNQYSLTELYNKGLDEVKDSGRNDIVVFSHNDILFETYNWGYKLLGLFNNGDYHIIGLAGSTEMPSSGRWWDDRSTMRGIVKHTNGFDVWTSTYSSPTRFIQDTVLVDGLFFAVDPDEIESRFLEEFKGFHFYEISFCIENWLDGCNIGVTTDILVLHQSVGETNNQWEQNRIQFIEKYNNELPIIIKNN